MVTKNAFKNEIKRRGRPPKLQISKKVDVKEESKSNSEAESEFDFRSKSAANRTNIYTRRMTRFQLKSLPQRDSSLEYKILSS